MDITGPRRRILGVSPLAAAAPLARRATGATTSQAVQPSAAVSAAGDDEARRQSETFAEHREREAHQPAPVPAPSRIVLQAVDLATGRILWQVPMEALGSADGEPSDPARATASFVPDIMRSLAAPFSEVDPGAAPAAYARDDTAPPGGPVLSRKA